MAGENSKVTVNQEINITQPKSDDTLKRIASILEKKFNEDSRDSTPKSGVSAVSKKQDGKVFDSLKDQLVKKTTGAFAPLFKLLDGSSNKTIKAWNNVGIAVVASANLGVAAVKKVGKAYMEFASFATNSLLTSSRKMITSNSLFIDNATRDMMQQTGQSAVETQGTQRSLDRLGLSFEDLQSGRLTEAQAKAFEEIRNREIEKLKELEAVGTSAFTAIQDGQMKLMQVQQDLQDMVSIALAKAGPALEEVMGILSNAIDDIMPAVEALMPVVTDVFSLLPEIIEPLVPVVLSLVEALGRILPLLVDIISAVLPPLGSIIEKIIPPLEKIIMAILPAFESILTAVMPLLDVIVNAFGFVAEVFSILMTVLNPIIDILVSILIPIFESLSGIFSILTDVLVLLAPIIEMVAGLFIGLFMPIFMQLQMAFEMLALVFKMLAPLINVLVKAFEPVMKMFKELFPIMDVFVLIMDSVSEAFEMISDGVSGFINKIIDMINTIPFINLEKIGSDSAAPKLGTMNNSNYNATSNNSNTINYNYGNTTSHTTAGLHNDSLKTSSLNLIL